MKVAADTSCPACGQSSPDGDFCLRPACLTFGSGASVPGSAVGTVIVAPLDTYARRAAEGMLRSLAHYNHHSPPVGDGREATPAYYANMLSKVLHHRGDTLPGEAGEWWGTRWEKYARHLITNA